MSWLDALILGLIQGLTEFLPVSSSGHLELGKAILGTELKDSLRFTVVVHGATVLSTIVVFYRDILALLKGLFSLKWNDEMKYIVKIIVSMIPVAIVGYFLKDEVNMFFEGDNVLLVGFMLIITSLLLASTYLVKAGEKEISNRNAFIIGVSQAFAVIPGISRSGATIATGLLLGSRRSDVAKFAFLMVLVPIIGENILELFSGEMSNAPVSETLPLIVGFIAAFISGLIACKWMLRIVRKGKLIYFAIYCLAVGLVAVIFSF
jgi:undecaprenyl-diphosphatase